MEGNHAFLRTGGYLPGNNDASVSPQIVRQFGCAAAMRWWVLSANEAERENQNQSPAAQSAPQVFAEAQSVGSGGFDQFVRS